MAAPRGTNRRSREEIRRQALAAARELLLAHGPAGMTLAGVAEKLDRSHSNIIHHFGSAENLQSALMNMMVEDLARALAKALESVGSGEARARMLVDAVFDAFDEGGAAVLAAWVVLSNKQFHLAPVRQAVAALARSIDERLARDLDRPPDRFLSVFLFVILCAFADALIGSELRRILGKDSRATRDIAMRMIPHFF